MDFRKISLWLFLLISSIYNSECKLLKKYQNTNIGGMDADDNCFCFKSPGNHKKVPEILSPNENNLERLVVYLYKDKLTNHVKLYIPNKEKQDFVPDLAFEVGDRLITVGDEKVINIFDLNARIANVASDVRPINEASIDMKKPEYLEIDDSENEQPLITPQSSDESAPDSHHVIRNQYLEDLPSRDPSSLEHGNFPIIEDIPPTNLDFDKSSYHLYDVPDAVPNYHEFYDGQDNKPNNNVIKIISQEINIPNKIIYNGVYPESQSDLPNHDFIYDHGHDGRDQVMSHEIKDPDNSIYGQLDLDLVHVPDPNKIIYNEQYSEPYNGRPFYIETDSTFGLIENITPAKITDDILVDNDPDFSDWDTTDFIDRDAEMDRPKSQEQEQVQETENSNPLPSQPPIEESVKSESTENTRPASNQLPVEENVKGESTENIKPNEEPNSSGQSNKVPNEEISEKEPEESPNIEVDNSGFKENMTCSDNKCTTDKSITAETISTENKSNEKITEPVENVSAINDTSADNVSSNNSKESEHEIKINDNHYETFDRWFIQQMDRFKSYTEHDRAINLLIIERYILKILHDNGMFVTSEGVLTDSFGTALDVNKLHLRPILIGNTMEFGSILNAKGTDLVMPANMAYLQAILVTSANPSMILGIIPIGKTVIPPSAANAFSTILTPYHSHISKKYPKHYHETKVNIKHVPGYKKRKPIVLHLSKHVPSTVRKLEKKAGETVITVVKKRPIIVQSHHRLRQPPKVRVFGIGSGESKFLTGDSADAVNKLIIALREGNDPMKSAEATNKLLASLRKNTNALDLTRENSDESSSAYSDDDIAERIVGGSAATGSGSPLSVKGRIKDY